MSECKADDTTGRLNIKGYASVFGNIDSYDDIVERGAFTETIANDKSRILLCFMHDMGKVIGKINEIKEDEKGLFIDADILPTSLGKDIIILLEAGAIKELSIGYQALDYLDEKLGDRIIRHLNKLKLFDISVVTRAANERAITTELSRKSEAIIPEMPTMSDEELSQLKSAIDNEYATRIFNHLKQ